MTWWILPCLLASVVAYRCEMAGTKDLGWNAWRKAGLWRAEARSDDRAMPLDGGQYAGQWHQQSVQWGHTHFLSMFAVMERVVAGVER